MPATSSYARLTLSDRPASGQEQMGIRTFNPLIQSVGILVRVSRSNSPNSIHRSIHVPAEEGVDGLRRLPRCGCDVAVLVGHLPGGVPYDRHPHWIAEASLTQHRRMEVTEVVDPNPGNSAGVTEPVEHVDNRRA